MMNSAHEVVFMPACDNALADNGCTLLAFRFIATVNKGGV